MDGWGCAQRRTPVDNFCGARRYVVALAGEVMRMRALAGGMSFGLGLGCALVIGLPQDGEPAAEESSVAVTLGAAASDDVDVCAGSFEQEVAGLLKARDQALIAGDAVALRALSTEGSTVRADDEELLDSLGGSEIDELRTRLDAVSVVDCVRLGPEARLEVRTTQEALTIVGEEPVGELPARCAVWRIVGQPWRLAELGEC